MSKAGVPAHAQRMSSLLAADREEPCQVERGACDVRGARCAGGARDTQAGERAARGNTSGANAEDPRGWRVLEAGHMRAAERTVNMNPMSSALDKSNHGR